MAEGTILKIIEGMLKLPFFLLFKFCFVLPLNLIRLPVYEFYGVFGYDDNNKPDLREAHTIQIGSRRLHHLTTKKLS
jgi:hypothetical protein